MPLNVLFDAFANARKRRWLADGSMTLGASQPTKLAWRDRVGVEIEADDIIQLSSP